jgi:hypothetical protein
VLRELPSNSELHGKLEVHRRKSSEDSELEVHRRKSSEDSAWEVQRRKSSEDSELEVQRRKRTSSSQATWDLVDLSGPEHREEQDIEECEPPCSTMQSEVEALPSVAKDSVYLSKTSTNTWDMVDAVEPDHSEKRNKDEYRGPSRIYITQAASNSSYDDTCGVIAMGVKSNLPSSIMERGEQPGTSSSSNVVTNAEFQCPVSGHCSGLPLEQIPQDPPSSPMADTQCTKKGRPNQFRKLSPDTGGTGEHMAGRADTGSVKSCCESDGLDNC